MKGKYFMKVPSFMTVAMFMEIPVHPAMDRVEAPAMEVAVVTLPSGWLLAI